MATLIQVDGTTAQVAPKDGRHFKLEELYSCVCPGDDRPIVEALRLPFGDIIWCHEEGKLRGLPVNAVANDLYGSFIGADDFFVGPILVTEGHEVSNDDDDE